MPATKFVLTGPRKGQTVNLVGLDFVKGESIYVGSEDDTKSLAHHLGTYYAAFPERQAEEAQARYEEDQAALIQGKTPEPIPAADPPAVKKQDLTPREPVAEPVAEKVAEPVAEKVAEPVAEKVVDPLADPLDLVKPETVAEALQALDADKDKHWTSRGLPSVDAVTAILGRTVARDEIEAAAEGFTRTAAKAAKAA